MNLAILICMPILALLGACSDTIDGKSIAEPAVARFHQQLAAKNFEAMYAEGSQEFQQAAPKEKVLALYAAVDRKLGPLQDAKQVNWRVETKNLVTTVVLVYESKFKEGGATETFTYKVTNGKAELVGYNINSLDMLIK